MSGGQNDLLLVMDMAKVGGPLSVVKVCTSMVCIKLGYRYISGWSPIGCESFYTNFNIPCPLRTTLYSLLLILSVTHIYIYVYIYINAYVYVYVYVYAYAYVSVYVYVYVYIYILYYCCII